MSPAGARDQTVQIARFSEPRRADRGIMVLGGAFALGLPARRQLVADYRETVPSRSWPNDCHGAHCLMPFQSHHQPLTSGT